MRRATQVTTPIHIAVRRLTRSATGLAGPGVTPTSSGALSGRRLAGSRNLRRVTVSPEFSGRVRGFSAVTLIDLAHSPEAHRDADAACRALVPAAEPEVAPARHQGGRERPRIPPSSPRNVLKTSLIVPAPPWGITAYEKVQFGRPGGRVFAELSEVNANVRRSPGVVAVDKSA